MIAYLFVAVPLGLYLPLFAYETYVAFRRLSRRGPSRQTYIDATWEVTHTLLVIAFTNFLWLFSRQARDVGRAMYWGLILAGAFFIVRAILYGYLFYVSEATTKHDTAADKLFAFSHVAILSGLVYAVVRAASVLAGKPVAANTAFIPWMWSGLILVLALGFLPLIRLYLIKK